MEYLNGKDLYQMFNYGSKFVLKKRLVLNDINVFPVPDGDTGNNLAHTMSTITRESKPMESFHETLESMSDSALIGARGNSGVIFAQFVNGLLSASRGKEKVSMEEFAEMANDSVYHTYASLAKPVEGTMLTVIKDWANALKNILKSVSSVKEFFLYAFTIAEKSLEKTKEKLAILKRNNVVDSGAMGFVLFLQGINSYFNKEEIIDQDYEEVEADFSHGYEGTIKYRYCTEGLVKFNKADEEEIKKKLDKYGDSLIVVIGTKMFRIHVHTNTPELVFQDLREYGTILSQKVDDMKLSRKQKDDKRKIGIVTDSIADISPDILFKNNVSVIPINVDVDGEVFFDKLTINNEILFKMIDQSLEYPKTSAPSIQRINDILVDLLDNYDELIVISVSSKLSATYNIIQKEIETLSKKGKKIHLIDTFNNSATQGLLVKKAIDMINDKKTVEEIVETIETMKKKTRILVCLETFKYAMMGGRLPKAVGKIGMALKMRPIMTLDKEGHGSAFGIAFSKKGITKKIKKIIIKEMDSNGIESYGLVHCLNPELVEEYKKEFTEIIGKEPEFISEVSSATSIHSGVGSVAIGYIRK